ncbi:MAG: TlpA family protein disulfide reductase [Balneolales bacterium]|nr:TlpA family protein disulfide reductase [Balneolales bacterium]
MIRGFILAALLLTGCSPKEQEPEQILVDATATEIVETIASFEGNKPVMVNVWATWCIPCVEEFPYIMKLKEEYGEEFELVFVSGDFDEARTEATEFLKEQNVNFTTYFKRGNDNEFITTFSDTWSGALPFTVIYDKNGNISSEWEGKAEYDTFETELLKVLNKG